MAFKSQSNEAAVIINYFGESKGVLLSIGENDGITFSNSFDLISRGWQAILVEPGELAFGRLQMLYKHNHSVYPYNFAIGAVTEQKTFYMASDPLLSTTKKELLKKWQTVTHQEVDMKFLSFKDAMEQFKFKKFDFITIDAEGMDWEILQQINLSDVGCVCLCIEHNGDMGAYERIKLWCKTFGLTREILFNGENTIMAI